MSAWDLNPGDLAGDNSENLMVRTLDTRDKAALQKAADETVERFGSIAGAAACAGIFRPKPFLELTQQDWDDHFGINLRSQNNGSSPADHAGATAQRHANRQLDSDKLYPWRHHSGLSVENALKGC